MTNEYIRAQVTGFLRREKIQLWNASYLEDGHAAEKPLRELAKRASRDLAISEDLALIALRNLQQHSLSKLQQQEKFKSTGVATLKLDRMQGSSSSTIVSIESRLDVTVADFKIKVSETTHIPGRRLVLIASGNVLEDSKTLYEQEVRNCSHIIALESDMKEKQDQESKLRSKVETWKADAGLLASSSLGDPHAIDITDQSGKNMKLPAEEKKALSVALALHEKGRKYLKKEDYHVALPVLLEADKEFSVCRSELLNAVDNYALLHLDVCWCYVNLKRIQCLPDAERRLTIINNSFTRTYGANLERLMVLKGGTGEEAALFMRLHLIEGIVAFHKGETNEALQKLELVEKELRDLEVDDDAVAVVLGMGYTLTQARVALRVKKNSVNEALNYIIEKEQKKAEERKKQKEELELQKKLLGVLPNGDPVDKDCVSELVKRGFNMTEVVNAVRLASNNLTEALRFMQNPDAAKEMIMKETVRRIVEIGFSKERATKAAEKNNGNMEAAMNDLIQNNVFAELDKGESSTEREERRKRKREEERVKKDEAYARLARDISTSPDDYLDVTTDLEKQILFEYKALLQSSLRRID